MNILVKTVETYVSEYVLDSNVIDIDLVTSDCIKSLLNTNCAYKITNKQVDLAVAEVVEYSEEQLSLMMNILLEDIKNKPSEHKLTWIKTILEASNSKIL